MPAQPVRRDVEHQPTGPLRGPQDSERLTVPGVVPRAAEAVDVVWISVPHADEITGACDLEAWKLTLTTASGTARPWLSTTSASTRSLCPGRQKNSRVAFRGAIAGEELAEHVLGRTAFYQRYKSPGVSLGDGEVADERLSKERGECLDRFGGSFKTMSPASVCGSVLWAISSIHMPSRWR